MRWLIVDEIDQQTGMLFCLDQDGEDFEVRESQIDEVLGGGSFGNDIGQELSWR
jgi:hypothetical protein